jgi:hypothetical protein
VCLTDSDLLHRDWYRAHLIECCHLNQNWAGDWAKLELFRPGLCVGRMIYLDLNLMITGSLFELGHYDGRFAASVDRTGRFDISVMVWEGGDLSFLYARFAADPVLASGLSDSISAWIGSVCQSEGIGIEAVQNLSPNLMAAIPSVPGGAPRRAVPPGTGLVSFHDGPPPHVLADGSEFIRRHWV